MPKIMLATITDGMAVQTQAYLKQKRLIPYKNKPGAFLVLTLADRSGSMEGKVFDNAEDIAASSQRDVSSISPGAHPVITVFWGWCLMRSLLGTVM